jgi:hypothetical protein
MGTQITGWYYDEVGQPVQPIYGNVPDGNAINWTGDPVSGGALQPMVTYTPTSTTASTTPAATTSQETPNYSGGEGYGGGGGESGSIWDQYATKGLDYASKYLDYKAAQYPTYTPSQATGRSSLPYVDYVKNQSLSDLMKGVNAPSYIGLMGGDYAALQQALTTPGQNAATSAYNIGTRNLTDVMGGRGLYGSSIMQNQQTQGLDKVYQEAVANNAAKAAAARYALQASDLANQNQFNQQGYTQQSLNALNQYQAGVTDAERQGTYNVNKLNWDQTAADNLRNWQNAMNYEKNFLYPLQSGAYANAINEQAFNRGLALAGGATPLSNAATQYSLGLQQLAQGQSQFDQTMAANLAQQQWENEYRNRVLGLQSNAASNSTNAANTASWLGLLGTGLGAGASAVGNAYNNYSSYAGNDLGFLDWLFS